MRIFFRGKYHLVVLMSFLCVADVGPELLIQCFMALRGAKQQIKRVVGSGRRGSRAKNRRLGF